MTDAAHFLESGLREKVIEHLFVGELLKCLWCRGLRDVEVLRAEVDRAGYDLVLEANGIMRHVQFKASYRAAKTAKVGIHTGLARKPGGCVIWIWFDPDTLELGPFLWFGGKAGEALPPLGDRVGRHTRVSRTVGERRHREAIRELTKGRFMKLKKIDQLIDVMFGVRSNQVPSQR